MRLHRQSSAGDNAEEIALAQEGGLVPLFQCTQVEIRFVQDGMGRELHHGQVSGTLF